MQLRAIILAVCAASAAIACEAFGGDKTDTPSTPAPSSTNDAASEAATGGGSDGSASPNVSIKCNGQTCTGGQVCCATNLVEQARCTAADACNGAGDKPVYCDDVNDCAAGLICCIRFADARDVRFVTCQQSCEGDTAERACSLEAPAYCGAGKNCVAMDSYHENDLGLLLNVCEK